MANNYSESDFKRKMKRFCTNRAVIVTFVTLLAAVGVIVAVTLAANRAKRPVGGGNAGESATEAPTAATPRDRGVSGIGDESMALYHEGESVPAGADAEPLSFTLPAEGRLVKSHDASIQVWSATMGDYRVHLGVDISTAEGAPVCAAAEGTVSQIWDDPMMGTCVALSHDGEIVTVYKNLDASLPDGLAVGAKVSAGQTIGHVGDSAIAEMADEPHLHYEMTVNGLAVDPLDYFTAEAVAALTASDADAAYESSALSGK